MRIRYSILLFLVSLSGYAQNDTLAISIKQADKIFLAANFQLMASAMNIEAQKAQEIQAQLFPNPVLTADFNAIDPENNQIFHVGSGGQKSLQIEQLILLGDLHTNGGTSATGLDEAIKIPIAHWSFSNWPETIVNQQIRQAINSFR